MSFNNSTNNRLNIFTSSALLATILAQPLCAEDKPAIFADRVFNQSTLIGKVFNDRNEDGLQNIGEEGIPGVRLATVSGLVIETDSRGRYYIPSSASHQQNSDKNFILKLDQASLPQGTTLTTENPHVIRQGAKANLDKLNFGIKLPF